MMRTRRSAQVGIHLRRSGQENVTADPGYAENCKNADRNWKPHPVTVQDKADTYAFARDVDLISEELKVYGDTRSGRAFMHPSGWVQENPGQAGVPASGSGQDASTPETEYSDGDSVAPDEVPDAPAVGDGALGAGPDEHLAHAAEAGEFHDACEWLFNSDGPWDFGQMGETGQQDLPRLMVQGIEGMGMFSDATGQGQYAVFQQIGDLRFAPPSEPHMQQRFVSQDQPSEQGLPTPLQNIGSWDGPDAWPQVEGYGTAGTQPAAVMPGHAHPHAPVATFTFGLDPDPESNWSGYNGAGMPQGGQEQGQLLDFGLDDLDFLPLVPEPQAPSHAAAGMQQGVQGSGNTSTSQQNGDQFLRLTPHPPMPGPFGFGTQPFAQDAQAFFPPQPNGGSLLHQQQLQANPFAGTQQSVQPHGHPQRPKRRAEWTHDEEPARKRQTVAAVEMPQRNRRQRRLRGMRSSDLLADPLAMLDLSLGPETMQQRDQIYGHSPDLRSTAASASAVPSPSAGRRESAVRPRRTQQVPRTYGQQPHPRGMDIAPSTGSSRLTGQTQAAQEMQQLVPGYGQQQDLQLGRDSEQRALRDPIAPGLSTPETAQQGFPRSWQQVLVQQDPQLTGTLAPPVSAAPMTMSAPAPGTMQQAAFTTDPQGAQAQQLQPQHPQQCAAPGQHTRYVDRFWEQQGFGTQQGNHGFGTGSLDATVPGTMQTGCAVQSAGWELATTLPTGWSFG